MVEFASSSTFPDDNMEGQEVTNRLDLFCDHQSSSQDIEISNKKYLQKAGIQFQSGDLLRRNSSFLEIEESCSIDQSLSRVSLPLHKEPSAISRLVTLKRILVVLGLILTMGVAAVVATYVSGRAGGADLEETSIIAPNPPPDPPILEPPLPLPTDSNNATEAPAEETTNYCPIVERKLGVNESGVFGTTSNSSIYPGNNNLNAIRKITNTNRLEACGSVATVGRGVWYSVVGTGAVLRASTCQLGLWPITGQSPPGFNIRLDTQLSVYTSNAGCSGGLQCVAGNDNFCLEQSSVPWFAEEGRIYYIYVHGKRSLDPSPNTQESEPTAYETGDFVLSTEVEPIGTCDGAILYNDVALPQSSRSIASSEDTNMLAMPSLVVDSLLGATFSIDPCSSGYIARGGEIWYRVQGVGNWIQASTCHRQNEFPARVAVYKGGCEALDCAVANFGPAISSVAFNCGSGYSLTWWSEPGTWYYLIVYKTNFLPGILFGLSVQEFDPPVNDNCTGAIAIPTDGSVTYGSTRHATFASIAPTCEVSHTHPGVWYWVVGTGSPLTASLCDDYTTFDTRISVFNGTCENLECVIGNDRWCGFQSSVQWDSVPGQIYHILIHGSDGGIVPGLGDFALRISEFTPTVNDHCEDASQIASTASITLGSTRTASADLDVTVCDEHQDTSSPGVWYTVVGSGEGLRASTCGGATNFDTRITIYRGDCGNLECVVTNDNGCGFQSSVWWHAAVGEVYHILVQGNLLSSFGDFALRIQEYRPTTINDFCVDAFWAMTHEGSINIGSTKNATFDGVETCVVPNTAPGTWYKVVGSGTGMIASTCHDITDFDTRLSVFRGTCKHLECVAGNDDGGDCGTAGSSVSWLSVSEEVYYILVHGWGALVGTFGLSIKEVVPSVKNDFCVKAHGPLPIGTNITSSTINATVDNVPTCGDVQHTGHGIWYYVFGKGSWVKVSTCEGSTNFDTQISIFRGGCGSLECLAANNDWCGKRSSVSVFMDESVYYYILVHGASNFGGDFTLKIEEIYPEVSNDFCDNAIGPLQTDTSLIFGSTTDATYSKVEECVVQVTSPGVWYTVVGTGRDLVATTCGDYTDFDTKLSVFSGNCRNLVCITGNDDTSAEETCTLTQSTASWLSIQGEEYFIFIHGWGAMVGNFSLSLSEV